MSATTLPPARWRRRKDARPQEILDAALAEFAARGFAATRMDDIARHAGVTKGTIYLYFPSKEDLFKSLARQSIGTAIADVLAVAKAFDGTSPELLRLILGRVGYFLSHSDRAVLPKILLAESGNFPELLRFWRAEVVEKGLELFGFVINRGIARGEFRRLEVEHVVRLCVAPLLLAALWRTTFAAADPVPYDLDGLVNTHIDVLLKGLSADEEVSP